MERTNTGVLKETLRVVSYNIKFSSDVPAVVDAFRNDPIMRQADLIFLQEVTGDPKGTQNAAADIASALGMNYLYSPAVIHPRNHLDFGNAILSKWPLTDFKRVLLPHPQPQNGNRRIALGATLWVGKRRVRLYSLHLETYFTNSEIPVEPFRADQVKELLKAIAEDGIDDVIVGGDFNSWEIFSMSIPRMIFRHQGFRYGNPGVYATFPIAGSVIPLKLDHIFERGFLRLRSGRLPHIQASDHIPIWMDFQF
jgi:endonuclease/exonuclease/phosphatase family metal-dependent hydrolase